MAEIIGVMKVTMNDALDPMGHVSYQEHCCLRVLRPFQFVSSDTTHSVIFYAPPFGLHRLLTL